MAFLGLSGWSGANRLRTAANGGPPGTATMSAGVVLRHDAVPAGVQFVFCRGDGVAAGGWLFWSNGAAFQFSVIDGATTLRTAPAYTIVAGDVGKVVAYVGTLSGGTVRLFRNDAEVGSGTAVTGYTPGNAATQTAIGGAGGGSANATQYTILGGAVANASAPTQAEAVTWSTYVRGRRRVAQLPQAGTTHIWQLSGGVPAHCLKDRIADVPFVQEGTFVDELGAWTWA